MYEMAMSGSVCMSLYTDKLRVNRLPARQRGLRI